MNRLLETVWVKHVPGDCLFRPGDPHVQFASVTTIGYRLTQNRQTAGPSYVEAMADNATGIPRSSQLSSCGEIKWRAGSTAVHGTADGPVVLHVDHIDEVPREVFETLKE